MMDEQQDDVSENDDGKTLRIKQEPGKSRAQMLAELSFSPPARHALPASLFAGRGFGLSPDSSEAHAENQAVVAGICGKVRSGNLDALTDMLASQAVTLDAMVSEYARCAFENLGRYPEAVERYTNLAMKAQSNCRTTVEALAKIKRGGKQHIQITHVHEGGQAIVAGSVSNGASAGPNRGKLEQAHEQAAHASVAALRSPDTSGNGVPLPSSEGQAAVSKARGR